MGAIKDIYDIISDLTARAKSKSSSTDQKELATVVSDLRTRIDELEATHQAELIAIQVENEHLRDQLRTAKPASNLSRNARQILESLFHRGPCGDVDRIHQEIGIEPGEAEYYMDELKALDLVSKRPGMRGAHGFVPVTACITEKGRAEVMRVRTEYQS